MSSGSWELVLPEWVDDIHAGEVEAKGVLRGAVLKLDGRSLDLVFYDPVRLAQDVLEEHRAGRVFFYEERLVVVPSVTRAHMESAAGEITATLVSRGDDAWR